MEQIDLSGDKDGISERFAPEKDTGRLIEAEHVTRYRWAAQAVAGRTVLDAGCGTAYGTKLLAEAGATEVVGIDIAEAVLDAVAPQMPDNVRLQAADLHHLPFADASFEVIACFEVIEHFPDPLSVLDELIRVLSADGVLLVSSPNRGVFPEGNPHHHHEFQPEELRAAVGERLVNVELVRQQDYLMSVALNDASFGLDGGQRIKALAIDKLVSDPPDHELYTLAVASNGALPKLGQLGVLTGTLEFGEWLRVFDAQTSAIHDKDNYIAELQAKLAERDAIAAQLMETEQQLAEIPALELQIEDLRFEVAGVRAAEQAAREEVRELDERLTQAQRNIVSVLSSPSWKLTKPLRDGKKVARVAKRVLRS